jgi:hypothetical protein
MIDWVDAMCRTWGFQKRHILYLKNADLRPPGEKKDGPPFSGNASSFLGRIKGARLAKDDNLDPQASPPEVLTGDALRVSCAIQSAIIAKHMTDKQYEALYVNYVIRGPLKVKMSELRVGKKCFYERLHRAHRILKPWLRENNLDRDNVTVDGVTMIALYG